MHIMSKQDWWFKAPLACLSLGSYYVRFLDRAHGRNSAPCPKVMGASIFPAAYSGYRGYFRLDGSQSSKEGRTPISAGRQKNEPGRRGPDHRLDCRGRDAKKVEALGGVRS